MELEVVDTVGSTMDAARDNVRAGRVTWKDDGQAVPGGVLALSQTQGRGQRGRVWFAQAGESLSATYYLRESDFGADGFRFLPFVAGGAVAGTLGGARRFPGEPSHVRPDIGLKWPNDLLLNGKKVGGILIEAVTAPDGERIALVGVGVNLGLFAFPPELASVATSFACEGLPVPEPVELGLQIGRRLRLEAALFPHFGPTLFLDRWRALDKTAGRVYESDYDGETVRGVAAGISGAGELLLRLDDGLEIAVVSASTVQESLKGGPLESDTPAGE